MEVSRKTRLAHNLEAMKKGFEIEYDFFPKTYIIPRDMAIMKEAFDYFGRSKHAFIVKPDGGCQGRGIFLTKNFRDIKLLKTTHVAQHYISDPFLIEGKKFDLRVYVLITSCNPLHVYLFKDGLLRMCTEDFAQPNSTNMDHKFMHLTNFAINKKSDQFIANNDESGSSGSKRSIKWFMSWLSDEKSPDIADQLWKEIGNICSKTILSIASILEKEYISAFGATTTTINSNVTPGNNESINVDCGRKGRENSSYQSVCCSNNGHLDHQNQVVKDEDSKNSTEHQKEEAAMIGSRCFTVLGIDVMIDSSLKPYLIEVNELPSFASGSPLDESIKSKVCYQALSAVQCSPSDQRKYEAVAKKRIMERYRRFGNRGITNCPETFSGEQVDKKKATTDYDFRASIKEIYAKFAPEKLSHIDELFKKYRGREKLLFRRVTEKYSDRESMIREDDNVGRRRSVDHDETYAAEGFIPEAFEFLQEYQLLVENGDFDRIYPPCGERRQQLWEKYKELEKYANDKFEQEQRRILLPLWLQRKDNDNADIELQNISENIKVYRRYDEEVWDCHKKGANANEGSRKMTSNKKPSKKQREASERLTRGFSVDKNVETINKIETIINKRLRSHKEDCVKQKITLKLRPINLEFATKVDDMKKAMNFAESKE
jgi:Tubulin-tyrosine ligase family.